MRINVSKLTRLSSIGLSACALLAMAACHPTMPNPASPEMRSEASKLSPIDYASQSIDTLERGIGVTVKNVHSDDETREMEGRYRHSKKDQPLATWMRDYCTAIGGQTADHLGSYCFKDNHVVFVLYSSVLQDDNSVPIWSYRIVQPLHGMSPRLESQLIEDMAKEREAREQSFARREELLAQETAQREARAQAQAQQRQMRLAAAHAAIDPLSRGAQICSKQGVYHFRYVGGLEDRQADRLLVRITGTTSGYVRTGEPHAQDVLWVDIDQWEPCQ